MSEKSEPELNHFCPIQTKRVFAASAEKKSDSLFFLYRRKSEITASE
jgi:hypothetical protein